MAPGPVAISCPDPAVWHEQMRSRDHEIEPLTPSQKAAHTGRWAEIMFRALTARLRRRWKFVSFRGNGGGEWRGVVDVLAVRKCTTAPAADGLLAGDYFDFVLVQLKGGDAAMPTESDIVRLMKIAEYYHALRVVLYVWKRRMRSRYYILATDGTWQAATAAEAFA